MSNLIVEKRIILCFFVAMEKKRISYTDKSTTFFVENRKKKELWDSLQSYTVVQNAFHCGHPSTNDTLRFEMCAIEEMVQKIRTVLKICKKFTSQIYVFNILHEHLGMRKVSFYHS